MPNTSQGFETTAYQGIVACALNTEMSDNALGKFVRFTVAGIRALAAPMAEVDLNASAAEDKTPARGRRNAEGTSARRGRAAAGEAGLKDLIYNWLAARGSGATRTEVINQFKDRYKETSIPRALSDLKKDGRANTQNGVWEAVPAPATIQQQSTAEMHQEPMLRDGTTG